ncbi:MAG: XRE family transcriptional regulator [Spirochaetia bacterium]|nr:XRE family transcriptional regulator [Spirochaetia bacterium]
MLKTGNSSFGEKIRRVREQKRLTLRELSKKAGVSESLISQIETGRVSPSIDTLLSLADYLEVDLEYLFSDYKRTKKAVVLRRRDRSRMRRAGVSYEQLSLLAEEENRHAVEAVLLEIDPGRQQGSRDYGHEGRELGIILAGRGELGYGKDTYSLGAGDSINFASSIPHVLRNTGKRPLRAIWIITPPKMRYFGGR